MTDTQEVEVLSLEKKIDFELQKVNVTAAVLADLENKYGNLRLSSVDDKGTYLEIKEAAKECSKWRNIARRVCVAGREEAVTIQKKWVAKEKEIIGRICEVENPLNEEVAKFEAEVERKANEKKRLQEEAFIQRQATLTRMGAMYSDGSFVLGEVSFESSLIKDADEETWASDIVPKFQIEYGNIEKVRIEEQRKKDEAEAEMRKQREELERQQAEFRRQQEEFNRQQEEIKRAEREKIEMEERRRQQERNELQNKRLTLLLPFNPIGTDVDMQNLWSLSESSFIEILESKKAEFEKAMQEKERILHEQWVAAQEEKQRQEEAKKRIEAEEEERRHQLRMDQAKDKEKWKETLDYLEKTPLFEMRSYQYRAKMKALRDFLDDIKNK